MPASMPQGFATKQAPISGLPGSSGNAQGGSCQDAPLPPEVSAALAAGGAPRREREEISRLRGQLAEARELAAEAEQSAVMREAEARELRARLREAEEAKLAAEAEWVALEAERRRGMQDLARSLVRLEDADTRRRIAAETVALGRPEGGRPSSLALDLPSAGLGIAARRLSAVGGAVNGLAAGGAGRDGDARRASAQGSPLSSFASGSALASSGAPSDAGDGAGGSGAPGAGSEAAVEALALPPGGAAGEVWGDGVDVVLALQAVRDATARRVALERERKALTRRLRAMNRGLQQKPASEDSAAAVSASSSSASSSSASPASALGSAGGGVAAENGEGDSRGSRAADSRLRAWREGVGLASRGPDRAALVRLDHVQAEEALVARLVAAKAEEAAACDRLRALGKRRAVLKHELIRVTAETQSRLRARPTLNERYQLLRIMGKGGFSEVWRALDLRTAQEVAVKVHSTGEAWRDTRKQHYIKHAVREYEIHRSLDHANIVRLLDVFPIDTNSFATVMELCRGPDLDGILKERGSLPEREARPILLQVLSALRYLAGVDTPPPEESSSPAGLGAGVDVGGTGVMPPPSKRAAGTNGETAGGAAGAGASRMKIIHYDLKPANVLFGDDSTAKVTDFGLSKILDDAHPLRAAMDRAEGDVSSMELTSQGAGTYWYLPPECFATGGRHRVMISNKVDVWSLGVLFYQCLYGKRPFGDGMSQDALVRERVMLDAKDVSFPPKPAVTEGAKAFIRACLQHDQRLRPDVRTLCTHSYLLL